MTLGVELAKHPADRGRQQAAFLELFHHRPGGALDQLLSNGLQGTRRPAYGHENLLSLKDDLSAQATRRTALEQR
jgi:hypothetical protein